jgi:hypothetical protein
MSQTLCSDGEMCSHGVEHCPVSSSMGLVHYSGRNCSLSLCQEVEAPRISRKLPHEGDTSCLHAIGDTIGNHLC